MKKVLFSLVLAAMLVSNAAAQFPYAAIVWNQPRSPTTNNVLTPATFTLNAALYQSVNVWSHGFSDSTDYGREYMFWADLGTKFNPRTPWQVIFVVNAFLARDPVNGDWWVVFSDYTALNHGRGAGGVSGRITWRYWH